MLKRYIVLYGLNQTLKHYHSSVVISRQRSNKQTIKNQLFAESLNTGHRNYVCSINIVPTNSSSKQQLDEIQFSTDVNSFTYRTHTCGELRTFHEGNEVVLCGWVQFMRLSKFLLLRDSYGLIQCIINENDLSLPSIPLETVVKVVGRVQRRPSNMINANMATGEVEVVIKKLEILNEVNNLPFNLRDYQKPKEQLRLQYRYIDLRFPEMQKILRLRSQMLHNMRQFLVNKHNFIEVETPTLFCRTPGGAREFVVPTRHPGLFYSLVQSPQQFKQMLMSGGIDRYFQVARCYRDESTRPDRQPEFTQLDIELSFTNRDGVLSMIEDLLFETYIKTLPKPPYKKITYQEAMESYGTDKPNTSFDLKLKNITKLVNNDKGIAFVLPYPKSLGKLTAKYKDKIRELSKKYNVKVILHEKILQELGSDVLMNLQNDVVDNSFIITIGDAANSCCLCLGEIRLMIAKDLLSKNLLSLNDRDQPLWVVDFPLFNASPNGLETCHHPFTAPNPDDLHLLDTEPLKVRSLAYDIVLNGNEVGGGSVRIHNVQLQEKILSMLKIDPKPLRHFLNALGCGCPPHAGIALGIDRLMSIACNTESIRDVIAFPKSHEGKDPLSGAPNIISEEDKTYYHIDLSST